jgi:hypothetical protein
MALARAHSLARAAVAPLQQSQTRGFADVFGLPFLAIVRGWPRGGPAPARVPRASAHANARPRACARPPGAEHAVPRVP